MHVATDAIVNTEKKKRTIYKHNLTIHDQPLAMKEFKKPLKPLTYLYAHAQHDKNLV